MPTKEVSTMNPTDNATLLNAIRSDASTDYRNRIPEATQASVADTLQNLTDYRPAWNEFIDALVNRIGLVIGQNNIWTNPLTKFKRGKLNAGDTIEEINVGLIKAKTYRPDRESLERDIFGHYPPDVQASYHKINRQNYYPITINEPLLKRAFLDSNGLQSFITDAMTAATTSDQWDEFLLTTELFAEYEKNGGFYKVNVPDISSRDSTAADAKAFLREVRAMAGTLNFLSTKYNASGMPVAVNPDDLELFITPEAMAAVDVEALAGAFNVDKADMIGRINLIPQDKFNIPGAQAILTTRFFFVIADTLIETSGVWNPVALTNNQFLHHHEIISASRYAPAVVFTTLPGTVDEIEETPVTGVSTLTVNDNDAVTVTEVERGLIYQLDGRAVTDGVNDAVRLVVEGATSTRTYVTQNGILHVGADERALTITVRAFAVDAANDEFDATVTVTVVGDLVRLWPNPGVETDSDKDGLLEATPEELVKDGSDNVTIPTVTGVQYKKDGVNVNNGTTHVITGTIAFTAVARSGYELATGATASWSFTV